jgi:two-component system, cell cycle sensor histidine kinase and response regulator CckA
MTSNLRSYPSARIQPRTILLVEDEPFVREATCRILLGAGFDVLPAADAEQAFDVYAKDGQRIDLVMSDVVLPGRSGRQLVQDLQAASPTVLALLTSGYLETECESDCPETRTYYLAKPYTRATLVEKIEQVWAAYPRRRAAAQAG